MSQKIIQELMNLKDEKKRKTLQKFFKTGKEEYGEGDLFLGIKVPETRQIAKNNKCLILKDIQELLNNKYHEVRLCGFIILVDKYEETKNKKKKKRKNKENEHSKEDIVNFYLKNLKFANNWDIVDLSCYKILGDYIAEHKEKRKILFELMKSNNIWERRVAIVSTFALIRKNEIDEVYLISEKLLNDKEDLIHKAVGWMLREAGKRDDARLKKFLEKHAMNMPRTMLRYSLEKFSEKDKSKFMNLPSKYKKNTNQKPI